MCHLVMKVQSCCTLSSRWTPLVGSVVTGCLLCRQWRAVTLSTSEAVQWKGSLSPLNTTCRSEGKRDSVCSSSRPSEEQNHWKDKQQIHRGKKILLTKIYCRFLSLKQILVQYITIQFKSFILFKKDALNWSKVAVCYKRFL